MRRLIMCCLLVFLSTLNGIAQSYNITTYAGPLLPASGQDANLPSIDTPYSVIADGSGGFYVASIALNGVYRVSASGLLTVIAGTGVPGFNGDGGPATLAALNGPRALALDSAGNLFIADTANNRIRMVTADGMINTVAGGTAGFSGDGGPAAAAQLRTPHGLTVDRAGNLTVVDYGNSRLRQITPDGIINTITGTGTAGFSGDGGPAIAAQINLPEFITVDGNGSLLIADTNNHRIRKISPAGIISTIAGTGTSGFSGDGGLATSAQLSFASGVALDSQGNLLIADRANQRVRKVTPAGIISTVAGSGTAGFAGDGGAAASARVSNPFSVAVDALGNTFIADYSNNRIRKVTPDGVIVTAAGNGLAGFSGDGGSARAAQFNLPYGVALDGRGNLLVADLNNNRLRRISPSGIIGTMAGSGTAGFAGDGGAATTAQLRSPSDVAVDAAGNIFLADSVNYRIRRITPDGVIGTFAGRGTSGFSGDNGAAPLAQFNVPIGIAVDSAGNLYIADMGNNRVRKVAPSGIVTTVAGTGTAGSAGDGGIATNAQLSSPYGVATDAAGNLFIADTLNHRIREVTPSGIITTVAGTGVAGFSGDSGPASAAQLNTPSGLTFDSNGNLLIADTNNSRIRRVTPAGVINTVAGNGTSGFTGDSLPATSAWLSLPRRLTTDSTGNIFIADTVNHRIRELIPARQSSTPFTIADRAGAAFQTAGTLGAITVGYASIQPDSGGTTPSGLAIFGLRQHNVLVSEAGVPASPLIRSTRIYAEVSAFVSTGLAMANPRNQDATIDFFFTDAILGTTSQRTTILPANRQVSAFLNQAPFNGSSAFSGTFTMRSSVPICVIALRQLINERGEALFTTLPVTELDILNPAGTVVLPHFADGGGWTTQIALVNPTDNVLSGTVQFRSKSGQAATINVNGQANSSFAYSLPARSSQKLQTSGASAAILTGSVRIVASASAQAPSALVIFSYRTGGITVAEAGVPVVAAATAFRMYAESSGDFSHQAAGSIQTGLALANPSSSAVTAIVEVQNMDGTTGLIGILPLPANGQTSLYLNEIPGLESLLAPFQGVLRISSTAPISIVGLRARYNERREPLVTTTPPVSESAPPSASGLFFPQIADSGGYTTQFILFNGQPGQTSTGTLRFFSPSGAVMNLVLR